MSLAERRLDIYEDLVESLCERPDVDRGTMMGFPCLRVNGAFFASSERTTHDLIVKLPKDRVDELVESRVGASFAPNGRVFKEWVLVSEPDRQLWFDLVEEALAFADES